MEKISLSFSISLSLLSLSPSLALSLSLLLSLCLSLFLGLADKVKPEWSAVQSTVDEKPGDLPLFPGVSQTCTSVLSA